jgi:hypothetical protein
MNPLPLFQEPITTLDNLRDQTAHVRPADSNAPHHLRLAAAPNQIDFRLSRSDDMNMRRFVIECVNHKPKALNAIDDDHPKTYLLGLWRSRVVIVAASHHQ